MFLFRFNQDVYSRHPKAFIIKVWFLISMKPFIKCEKRNYLFSELDSSRFLQGEKNSKGKEKQKKN